MKKIFLLLLLLTGMACNATEMGMDSVLQLGLPVVVVETINHEEPTSEKIDPPEGCFGTGITKATKVPGRVMVISVNGDTIFDSGDYVQKKKGMTIKHRGNSSSAWGLKKAFKIKLQKKGDMLGRGSLYADKNWALLKNDVCNLNTLVGLKVSELVGQDWTPAMRYVNLVFNGDFRGIYMLSETVERNEDCRINVGKSGYIIESDPYWWNEDLSFDGAFAMRSFKFTFKYPDPEDITDESLDYIKKAVAIMDSSFLDTTYYKAIDVGSFVNWLLIHDLLGSYDAAGSNRFLTKMDSTAESLFKMGPAWDFDAIFGDDCKHAFAPIHKQFYYQYLFPNSNELFKQTYMNRWAELKQTFFTDINDFLEYYRSSDEAKAVDKSWDADADRWGWDGVWTLKYGRTVSENIDSIENWFNLREVVLDSLVAQLAIPSRISNAYKLVDYNPTSCRTYNLMGQEVHPDVKELVIRKGKKFFNR